MIKNLVKILISILVLFVLIILYLSYFGIETSQFNSTIKKKLKEQNTALDIELNRVKLHLDLKTISVKIKTKNPKIRLNNTKNIDLDEILANISIKSYLKKKFAVKKVIIKTKNNELRDYINFYSLKNNSLQLILLKQVLKNGKAKINADLNFDDSGKIKNNYKLTGKVSDVELKFPKNKKIKKLNFNFYIKENDYKLEKILFQFNKISFNSKLLSISRKNDKFFVKGNLKNDKDKINEETLLLIFNNNLKNFDYSNSKFDSISDFSFDISNKLKVKNLKVSSELYLDEMILKYDFNKIKKYVKEYNNLVKFKENKFHIKYSNKKILIDGSSEFYIDKKHKNLVNFNIEQNKNKTVFETLLNLENIDLNINDISYKKIKKNNANLVIKGFKNNNIIFFKNLNYTEGSNKIEINNLEINNNKILDIHKIRFDYKTKDNFKNKLTLIKKGNNYQLIGKSFDGVTLIENISKSESDKNFFKIFKNLNSEVKINIDKVKLDKKNYINNLIGNLEIKKSKIFNLDLNSSFSEKEKIFLSIKSNKDNSIVTTFHSDIAEPFVKKYKFIKGFEDGNIDFNSTKINNITKSKLTIDNFKVKEVPVLAKILTLASLQGIADLLTGEGVRFTDFEMIYSKKGGVTTIDEIYAIGPAISIMMEGYVEEKKLISLRGTLVPATTINRTIASIPLIGDILIGKKVGEGVFGVSFKIKGPPKKLKTTVNPIKTLTPRFITRTLEKIKKN